MRRSVRILLCSLVFGLCVTGCMLIPRMQKPATVQVAWWNLIYERPNPEQLPVRIHFRWAKGLESAMENRYNMIIE